MLALILALFACVPETAEVPPPDEPVPHPAERAAVEGTVSALDAEVQLRAWPVMVGEGWGMEVEVSSQTPQRQVQATPAWGPVTLSGIVYEGTLVVGPFTEGAALAPLEVRPLEGTYSRTWPAADGKPAGPGQLVELSVGLVGLDAGGGFTSVQLGLVRMVVEEAIPPAKEGEEPVVPTPRLEIEPAVTTTVQRPGSTWHLSALPLLVPEQGWVIRARIDGWASAEPLPLEALEPSLCGMSHTLEPGPELTLLPDHPVTRWLSAPAQGEPPLGPAQPADLVLGLPALVDPWLASLHAEPRPSRSPTLSWGEPKPCP